MGAGTYYRDGSVRDCSVRGSFIGQTSNNLDTGKLKKPAATASIAGGAKNMAQMASELLRLEADKIDECKYGVGYAPGLESRGVR